MTNGTTLTKDQWSELHTRTLDGIRAVLLDLSGEQLLWEPETTRGHPVPSTCHEPRPFCIAAIVAHLCDAERQRLAEVNIRATFAAPRPTDWNPRMFLSIFDLIEVQYSDVLDKWVKDRPVMCGLGRACQHNLYHLAQIIHLRCLQEPQWQPPPAGQSGSWEHAANFIADLLVLGDRAPIKTPKD